METDNKLICGATLTIGDDYGDNERTIHCQLEHGHTGRHKEEYRRPEGAVTITWEGDDRRTCVCGHPDYHHYLHMKSDEKGIVLEERKGGCHTDYQGMSVLALNWDFGWDTPEPPKKEGQCSCQKFELYQGPRIISSKD